MQISAHRTQPRQPLNGSGRTPVEAGLSEPQDFFQSGPCERATGWGRKALMAATLALAVGTSGCATYGGYGYYPNNAAQVVGGALVGAVIGGAIAHELSQPYYAPPHYGPYYNQYNNCMGCAY
ncbi:hypothetical protein JST97_25395 [bacterium]|nr:hypothetical protein [bacterium]